MRAQLLKQSGVVGVLGITLFFPAVARSAPPDAQDIIQKSVVANQHDFQSAPDYNHKERDRTSNGSKTYQVTMIEGSPYQRLIAVNGKPLSPGQNEQEQKKQEQAIAQRRSESSQQRQERIAKYQKDRKRDHAMMEQLTRAFDFKLIGQSQVRGFTVYVLKATPKPGYQPPNIETQVLPGMQGELWIDTKTYQWVKVTARVIHPVSIEGFLAQVEPGTQFELEKSPVDDNVWLASHFSMKSQAKVLYLFNHNSSEDDTYFDYERAASPGQDTAQSAAK
jgi:hypothetical protein